MNKQELITAIAEKSELNKKQAEKVINAFTDIITETLRNGDKVQLVGFGSFEVIERAARTGRNPQDSSIIEIPASKTPKFKASKSLKMTINEQPI